MGQVMATNIEEIQGINARIILMRDKNITTLQCFILSLFLDISITNRIPANKQIAKAVGSTKGAVSNALRDLISKGYLVQGNSYSNKQAFDFLNKKGSSRGCLFCGAGHITLDAHHYPVRKKDGGTDTILLCPNCHRHFHELVDFKRNLTMSKEVQNAR